jgi:hypothetical protein
MKTELHSGWIAITLGGEPSTKKILCVPNNSTESIVCFKPLFATIILENPN